MCDDTKQIGVKKIGVEKKKRFNEIGLKERFIFFRQSKEYKEGVVMKFGLGQKRFKGAEVEFEHKGGWGRSLGMASFPTLPRYLLAGVLGLQLFILIILRGLPLPFPWLTPCPSDLTSNVETNSSNLVVAKNGINNVKDLGLGTDISDSGNAIDNASDLGNDRLDVGNGRFDLGSDNNASSDLGLGSSVAVRKSNVSCDLGMVYVYRLPPVFNDDLLRDCDRLSPWKSFCPVILNSGYGDLISSDLLPAGQHGAWYKTDQFTGEIIFHKKLLEHPCVTDDPEKARAFYVPFYVGLAVGRYLWREYPAEVRDRDAKMAIEWLQGQEPWRKNMGWDHFLMVGRITWDFRRSKDEDWGSSFLHMKEMQNTTRLLIERNPWDDKEMGVPYPTAFHPRSVEDMLRWQEHLRGLKRSQLFVFAGASRKFIPNDFRGILLDQCRKSRSCTSLNCSRQRCSNDTMVAVRLFMDSTFCLQPRGDSFTRRSIFDCLIAGSIPVFFWHRTAYWQYQWHLPSNASSYSVFISKHDIRNGTQIEEVLRAIPDAEVQRLRETVISSIPNYVYTAAGHRLEGMKDAVDIAVDGVLNRVRSFGLST